MTTLKETTIPLDLLKEASQDAMLHTWSVSLDENEIRTGIYADEELIGFFTPSIEIFDGNEYWRTGTIYIQPAYRGHGHGKAAIQQFFAVHPYGLTHIREDNLPSLMTYTSVGFLVRGKFVQPKNNKTYLILTRVPEDKDHLSQESLMKQW